MTGTDFGLFLSGILVGFLMSFQAWAYSTQTLRRDLVRMNAELNAIHRRRS
jgi:hypothetical protein